MGLESFPSIQAPAPAFSVLQFRNISWDADLYFKKKNQLILGKLAAILYDDVIIYSVQLSL